MFNTLKSSGVSSLVLVAALAATPAMAETVSRVKVFDHTKTIVTNVPTNQERCQDVKVPYYENVYVENNAGEGALMGMIIGGLLGKGATGDDGGAAAGAVIGGIIGANESQGGTERRIAGYTYERQCSIVQINNREQREVYSHSTIRFYLDGKRHVLEFQR